MERAVVVAATVLTGLGLASAFVHAADSAAPGAPGAGPARRSAGLARSPLPPSKDAVDWAVLTAYEYQPGLAGLPAPIRALEGRTVAIRGFLLPLAEWDDLRAFFVVPHPASCCFGRWIGLAAQVHVQLRSGERGLPNTNEPVEVRGTFRAVETQEQGLLISIFRLDDATATVLGD